MLCTFIEDNLKKLRNYIKKTIIISIKVLIFGIRFSTTIKPTLK